MGGFCYQLCHAERSGASDTSCKTPYYYAPKADVSLVLGMTKEEKVPEDNYLYHAERSEASDSSSLERCDIPQFRFLSSFEMTKNEQ